MTLSWDPLKATSEEESVETKGKSTCEDGPHLNPIHK